TGAATYFVATDGINVYWAAHDVQRQSYYFIFATGTRDDQEVIFPAGKPLSLGPQGDGFKYQSAIGVSEGDGSAINGLAVQRRGRFLVTSHHGRNEIRILDKTTGALVAVGAATSPGSLAFDAADALWVTLVRDGRPTIGRFTIGIDGRLTPAG